MLRQSLIRGLIASVLFVLLEWIGDKFIFEQESSITMYFLQGLIFSAVMIPVYYFLLKKQVKKD